VTSKKGKIIAVTSRSTQIEIPSIYPIKLEQGAEPPKGMNPIPVSRTLLFNHKQHELLAIGLKNGHVIIKEAEKLLSTDEFYAEIRPGEQDGANNYNKNNSSF